MIDLAETCPDRIEARVRLLEDRAEIFQLMAAYGPSDAMDAETLGEGHSIARISANCGHIVGTPAGWRIAHRLNRHITGEDASRAVLAQK